MGKKIPGNSVSNDLKKFSCMPCGKHVSCEKQGRADVVSVYVIQTYFVF